MSGDMGNRQQEMWGVGVPRRLQSPSMDTHYIHRIVDDDLDELLPSIRALSLEGPKAVGKTFTAKRRAKTTHRLDDPAQLALLTADMERLTEGEPPILVDEYQRLDGAWDRVRRAVDDGAGPFLLTGSASSDQQRHSGAGRIVILRMRPLALSERGLCQPTVLLHELAAGERGRLHGRCPVRLDGYVDEILRSGFPAIRRLNGRALNLQLDGYLERIVDRDIPDETGLKVRRPAALRAWLAAYAAATATSADYTKIAEAAAPNSGGAVLDRKTAQHYRDVLTRLWILDPLEAWAPTMNRLTRLAASSRHHLTDTALAARLLGVGAPVLLGRATQPRDMPVVPRDGTLAGALFESLVVQSVRVYAQRLDGRVFHLRTRNGEREVDMIVELPDGRIIAIEVKMAQTIGDHDVRHLRWIHDRLGDQLADALIITTGTDAYRRQDGIGVVPAALLGP